MRDGHIDASITDGTPQPVASANIAQATPAIALKQPEDSAAVDQHMQQALLLLRS